MAGQARQRAALRAARRFLAGTILASALTSLGFSPVAAHGEQLLQLGSERIQPGGTVEVRGDLGSGESFEVALVARVDGSRRLIATIPAVDEGHFQSFVTIPADVAVGDYLLEVAIDLSVVRAPLEIAGSPIGADGGAGPEQEDGLVVPLPSSFGRANTGAGAVAAASPGSTRSAEPFPWTGSAALDGALVLGAAIAAGAGLLVALRARGRRSASTGDTAES
jgi:hypothetical protein